MPHDHATKVPRKLYEQELVRLQVELVQLKEWVRVEGVRLVVLFEGRDAAGKGGAIKRVSEYLNPRVCASSRCRRRPSANRASGTSSATSRTCRGGSDRLVRPLLVQRAGVEHVMGFCTPAEHRRFFHQCPIFERLLVEDGIISASTGSRSATRSRSAVSGLAWRIHSVAGSCRRSTSSRARGGSSSRGPRTRCSCTPTSTRRRGSSSRATTSVALGSTALPTCCRRSVPRRARDADRAAAPPAPGRLRAAAARPLPLRARLHRDPALLRRVIGVVVDLNADVGEGFAADAALVSLVTSVNVACGFHAGDAPTMLAVCTGSRRGGRRDRRARVVSRPRGLRAPRARGRRRDGGHGGRRADRGAAGRGGRRRRPGGLRQAARRPLSPGERRPRLRPRRGRRDRRSRRRAARRARLPRASALLAQAARPHGPLSPKGSPTSPCSGPGRRRPRSEPGSLLAAGAAARQALALAEGRLGGGVRSICIHGDGPEAAAVAAAVREALVSAHVELRPFA